LQSFWLRSGRCRHERRWFDGERDKLDGYHGQHRWHIIGRYVGFRHGHVRHRQRDDVAGFQQLDGSRLQQLDHQPVRYIRCNERGDWRDQFVHSGHERFQLIFRQYRYIRYKRLQYQ
jgi:hypothetical protein